MSRPETPPFCISSEKSLCGKLNSREAKSLNEGQSRRESRHRSSNLGASMDSSCSQQQDLNHSFFSESHMRSSWPKADDVSAPRAGAPAAVRWSAAAGGGESARENWHNKAPLREDTTRKFRDAEMRHVSLSQLQLRHRPYKHVSSTHYVTRKGLMPWQENRNFVTPP
mmetsp:Transcript_5887/g.7937  ORF Transcript_5887/g.7937 Transcript_5887/m.7937 type:complete len:168 (+) Transcript_5887:203-706(+)